MSNIADKRCIPRRPEVFVTQACRANQPRLLERDWNRSGEIRRCTSAEHSPGLANTPTKRYGKLSSAKV